MLRLVTLHHRNTQRRKHRRHWRVNILIRTGHTMFPRLQHPGERGHRGSTDSDQVIVHTESILRLSVIPCNRHGEPGSKSKLHKTYFAPARRGLLRQDAKAEPFSSRRLMNWRVNSTEATRRYLVLRSHAG